MQPTARCPRRSDRNDAMIRPDLRCTCFLLLACLMFSIPLAVNATDFEKGRAAYQAKDYEKAFEILKPLAEEGNSQAQVTLGIMYDYGHGVKRDPAEALKWYIKAAEQGIPVVQHDVGVKYFQGAGVERDYLEASKWWELSANAGLADSQFNLGLLYYRGLGVEKNNERAAELFRQAAEQGNGHAQYSLAVMYAFGQGMKKDYEQAYKWFSESANQNVAQAQYNLGIFYENGYGVERDMTTARQWYERAADQGLAEAKNKLAELDTAGEAPVTADAEETVPEISPSAKAPPPEPETDTAMMTAEVMVGSESADSSEISNEWAMQQRPDSYTLQLASVLNEKDIVKFIRNHNIETKTKYIRVYVKEKTRYSAIYGVYDSYEAAENAKNELPEKLRKGNPWIRNFGVLQKLLQN